MYFHLIWIKEKNWNKYDLNLILKWWSEDFIRSFLSNRWVVIVSINEFKDDPYSFWNIDISLIYDWAEIQIIAKWENLSESMLFFISLWLRPTKLNYIDKPISEDEMKSMLNSTILTVKEEDEEIKKQEDIELLKEKKKYEESSIKDWIRIINSNIDHIEQVLKAGQWILSSHEIKELENYLAEMKKIRLWTNFNKMTSLFLDSSVLVENAENEIFNASNQNKFLIDKNSAVTNIDVLREYFDSNRVLEKRTLYPEWLSTSESVTAIAWQNFVFFKLLKRDIIYYLNWYSLNDFLGIVIHSLELIVLIIILIVSLTWLIGPLVWVNNFSLYLLPAMGRLWLLIYLLNGLSLKWFISKIVCFFILVGVYWYWLTVLLNTFAL